MAKAPKPPKDKKPASGGGKSAVWLSGLACGALVAIAPGTAALAFGLLAPGLLAAKFDREAGRPVARAVLLCGLAGCVHPTIALWNMGQSFDTAMAILSDPATLGRAWAAAAAGWLMTQAIPLGVRAALEAGAIARTARLRLLRERIAEAWGLDDPPGTAG